MSVVTISKLAFGNISKMCSFLSEMDFENKIHLNEIRFHNFHRRDNMKTNEQEQPLIDGPVKGCRGVFRTQSKVYERALLRK